MTLADLTFFTSMTVMRRTGPFVALRSIVYFGIAVANVLLTGTGAGIGLGVGAFGDTAFQATSTFWGGAIGFGATASVLKLLRE